MLSPHAGRGEVTRSHSRDAPAPEFSSHQPREARILGLRTKTERWILCFPVRLTPFAEPNTVARMERSEIRGLSIRFKAVPGLRFAPSGLRKKKGSGTPTNADPYPPHHRVRLCPFGAARLSASHHGSRQRESSSLRLSSRPGFLGRGLSRCYLPSPVPAQGTLPAPVIVPGD